MASNLIFDIIANDKASKILDNIGASIDGQGKKWDSLKVSGRVATGVLAGGLAALGAIVHTGTGEAMDAARGQAQLEAGIRSTNNAAGVTVDGLESLASEIQNYSGQTDDSIVKSEQLLLTFTNIKNSGPDKIFDLATKATADMAAKMGTDAAGSAVMLGKALNDPIKGIAALAEVGVTFTQSQKDSVAAMVAAGDTAGAQKVILAELATEFGGAAKAAGDSIPGQMDRGKRSFEDFSQAIVSKAMPAVGAFAGAGLKVLDWMNANQPAAIALAAAVGVISGAVAIAAHWEGIYTTAKTLGTAAQWAWNAAATANPIGLIIIGIAALVAGIVWVATKTTFFQTVWTAAWGGIQAGASAVANWFTVTVPAKFSAAWNAIASGASGAINWIVGGFNNVVGFVTGMPGRISRAASGMWDGIRNSFRGVINWVISGWNRIHLTLPSIDTHIPGIGRVGGFTLRVPQMPYLARGGVVDRATLMVAGEAGTEAVLPFDRATEFADMVAASLNPRPSVGASQEVTTIVNLDGREIYRVVKKIEAQEEAR